MSLPTSIAIYFIIWWTVLFAVLPWGVRSQQELLDRIALAAASQTAPAVNDGAHHDGHGPVTGSVD